MQSGLQNTRGLVTDCHGILSTLRKIYMQSKGRAAGSRDVIGDERSNDIVELGVPSRVSVLFGVLSQVVYGCPGWAMIEVKEGLQRLVSLLPVT